MGCPILERVLTKRDTEKGGDQKCPFLENVLNGCSLARLLHCFVIFEKLKLPHSFVTTILFCYRKLQSREDFPSSQIKVFMKESSCKKYSNVSKTNYFNIRNY